MRTRFEEGLDEIALICSISRSENYSQFAGRSGEILLLQSHKKPADSSVEKNTIELQWSVVEQRDTDMQVA